MSRGFIASMAGFALTVFSWYGPWAWPAWPAFAAIDVVFGRAGFADYSFATKAVIVVGLIIVNVSFWAGIAWVILSGVARARRAVNR